MTKARAKTAATPKAAATTAAKSEVPTTTENAAPAVGAATEDQPSAGDTTEGAGQDATKGDEQAAADTPQPAVIGVDLANEPSQAAAHVSVRRLDDARALPVVDASQALPTTYAEGSIEQFKAEDRRTMRVVGTAEGLAAVAVESEA